MSNKSTPVQQRIHQFQARARGTSTPGLKSASVTTFGSAGGLRRKVLATRTPKRSPEKVHSIQAEQLLNTAFTGGVSTPRSGPVPKSTVLNACYTPSSLYRNPNAGRSTPAHQQTPSTHGKSANKVKEKDALLESSSSNAEESNMIVAVRVRPLKALECTRNITNVVHVNSNNNELTVQAGTTADASAGVTHFFSYDQVYYSCDPELENYACQTKVFEGTAQPLIDTAFEGYNACLFAYGQTGSGKSYSMMGIEALDDAALDGNAPHAEAGIIPRFCHELFRRIEMVKHKLQVEIEVSYFEIYNEKIHDLLCVQQAAVASQPDVGMQRQALKVREHPIWGPYVVDLSVHSVDTYAALRNWLAVGNSQRATASTAMNDKSSRSHSIFNIVLNLTDLRPNNNGADVNLDPGSDTILSTRRSKISLVDLAGSERISYSGSNGERIREGVSINKSLLTLGKVIAALADSRKVASGSTPSTFVPYRESVLTWLLRENLGGNSKTVMLATISPASLHVEETLATLRYACKARSIVNRVKVNESPHDKIIRDLRAEVDRLKSLRNEYERQRRLSGNNSNPVPRKIIIETSVDDSEVEALRQQLAERERELNRAQKSWMEKLQEAEDQRKSELRLLKRKGLALELAAEQKQACLVNLTADPILSGTLFYLLPPGEVRVGRGRLSGGSLPDIVLDGPLVALQHCLIEHERGGKLFVTPGSEDFETYVNGELLQQRQQLFHGDRLVIGGSHYFRISNPFCTLRSQAQLVDFQLAHQEILQKQEQQLRSELEAEKRAALSRIEQERAQHARDFEERLQCLELEQFKYKCNSELLETERLALAQQQQRPNEEAACSTPAQKSTLLEDIQRIMLNPSEESLHKTQLMVKEATQRCRQLGLLLEFRQTQTPDEFGLLRTVILILDKRQGLKAEWPIARLSVWLDMMRQEQPSVQNVFQNVELDWQAIDADLNETLNEPHNSSRIALNLSAMKDVLLKQPLRRLFSSTNNTPAKRTSTPSKTPASASPNLSNKLAQYAKRSLTYDAEDVDSSSFTILAHQELLVMQRAAQRLRHHCEQAVLERENQQDAGVLAESLQDALDRLDTVLHGLRNCLTPTSPTKQTQKVVRFLID
ncbi:kinesin-like protein KIF14 [Scaptodrosophila lebanonensis]|uniref:Kinesin-like protein KIF14 n=1 Tax=Drosophila lebanonensis TaxID=7225 RepID=A0A6J2TMA9_DROLE|nr:kinesin-like protein KIF14 [Scaptodrosophila lebanonensis]